MTKTLWQISYERTDEFSSGGRGKGRALSTKLYTYQVARKLVARLRRFKNDAYIAGSLRVRLVTTALAVTYLTIGEAIAEIEKLGHAYTGPNHNLRQRAELQGAPKFTGLLGPMWDGDALRYEDAKTYAQLSQ